jgi:hypothetical protein
MDARDYARILVVAVSAEALGPAEPTLGPWMRGPTVMPVAPPEHPRTAAIPPEHTHHENHVPTPFRSLEMMVNGSTATPSVSTPHYILLPPSDAEQNFTVILEYLDGNLRSR